MNLRLILGVLAIGLSSATLWSQGRESDSLELLLTRATDDAEQLDLLRKLYDREQDADATKSLNLAYRIEALSEQTGMPQDRMDAYNRLGIAYLNLNKADSAQHYFEVLSQLANSSGDSSYLSKAYNNMGALYGNLGNYQSCIYYFEKSARIDERINDIAGAVTSYINIGTLYGALGSVDSARYFLEMGLTAAIKFKDQNLEGVCEMNLGVLEMDLENRRDAITHFERSIALGEATNDLDLVAKACRNLAFCYQSDKNYLAALKYDRKGLETAEKSGDLENALRSHVGLAASYEHLKMFEDALKHFKSYKNLQDSITKLENNNLVIEMQEKYKADQTEKENKILSQRGKIQDLELAKNSEQIRNSRIIIVSSVVGILLLLVLAVTLYNRNILRQRANQKLQEAYAIIQEKNSDIMASIDYASKIQQALLPTNDDPNLFADSFFLLRPKDVVSGDFLWYTTIGNYKIFTVVDCTGHGVPGAFMSMIGNTFLHQIISERGITEPSEVLNQLREMVVKALTQKGTGTNRKDGMDMALCVFDTNSQTLKFAGANNPMFLMRKGKIEEVRGDKQPVGFFHGVDQPFTQQEFLLNEGDVIYIFSDGYADQFGGPRGKKFKYRQMIDLFERYANLSMQEQKKIIAQAFDAWKGDLEQVDDVCVVGVRI